MMSVQVSTVLWLYGLPGSGKSTLARKTADAWRQQGRSVVVLDGDDLRSGLSAGLGFTDEERGENIRRAAEVAALLSRQGVDVIAALVTPMRHHRDMVRQILHDRDLHFYWVRCSLEACMKRDPQGLYSRALRGEVREVTGLDAPFEEPAPGTDSVLPSDAAEKA